MDSLSRYIAELRQLGEQPALVEQGLYRTRQWSYRQLLDGAAAFQAELQRRKIGAGDRLLLWGHAGGAWAMVFYGCVLAGVVLVPADAGFSPDFVARIARHTEAKLLCADAGRTLPGAPPLLSFEEILTLPPAASALAAQPSPPETLLEIVYTSGATAEPKGVMITHGNLLANLQPIQKEVEKYKGRARWVLPLRFVHLIPLSHLFGQVMGLLIPTLLDSCVVFPETQAPAQLAELIRVRRASVMVLVPQQLEAMSRWALQSLGKAGEPLAVEAVQQRSRGRRFLRRWWIWRRLHRRLGWKMWAFIVGGAALEPGQEEIWNALGYAVVQGYGLTETAPAVAITHPFKIQRGAVGRKLGGMEIRIASDGEILVRGGNVSPGYYRNPHSTAEAFTDGWLNTGDLGRLDEQGNLILLGRKKEVIVTANGLNVYPQDVEAALNAQPEIAESAVVGKQTAQGTQVHAVAVLASSATGDGATALASLAPAVARANERLEPHQRIRGFSVWEGAALPRTASTHKLQRTAVARWVNREPGAEPPATIGAEGWREFLARRFHLAPKRLLPDARLSEDLGLSSLDRVELLTWAQAHLPFAPDELAVAEARTVADLTRLFDVEAPAREGPQAASARAAYANPAWPMHPVWRWTRVGVEDALMFPLLRTVARLRVEGGEHLAGLRRPVLFIANHQSLLDVPTILWALPNTFRPWLAPAMGAEAFAGALGIPSARHSWRDRLRLFLTRALLNGYLFSDLTGVQAALRFSGRLADAGYCPLLFPEGTRTRTGELGPFRPGLGVLVEALGIPVVPIVLRGLFEILPTGARHARPGAATVRFAPPLELYSRSAQEINAEIEAAFRREWQRRP